MLIHSIRTSCLVVKGQPGLVDWMTSEPSGRNLPFPLVVLNGSPVPAAALEPFPSEGEISTPPPRSSRRPPPIQTRITSSCATTTVVVADGATLHTVNARTPQLPLDQYWNASGSRSSSKGRTSGSAQNCASSADIGEFAQQGGTSNPNWVLSFASQSAKSLLGSLGAASNFTCGRLQQQQQHQQEGLEFLNPRSPVLVVWHRPISDAKPGVICTGVGFGDP